MLSRTFCLVIGLLFAPWCLLAAEPQPPAGFRAIFNGKDLTGWHGLNPHGVDKLQGEARTADLQKQRDEFSKHWRIEDGNW